LTVYNYGRIRTINVIGGLVLGVLEIVVGVLVGMFVLMFLVTAHEFGHFIMARKAGIVVQEFGIGMPPRGVAWQKKDGKWVRLKRGQKEGMKGGDLIFSLNWLLIGGFCKMKDESDAATEKGSFGRASFLGKTGALFGGVAANFLVAVVIFTILAWVGMPHFLEGQFSVKGDTIVDMREENYIKVANVIEGSPAVEAGLEEGDVVFCIGVVGGECEDIVEPTQISQFTREHFGEEIKVGFRRGEADASYVEVRLPEDDSKGYVLGIATTQEKAPLYRSTWSAPIVGVGTAAQLTGETFVGIGRMVGDFVSGAFRQVSFDAETREEGREAIGRAGEGLAGPIGIVGMIFPQFLSTGLINLLFLAALISVSLACMNLLPIPALDGGRWTLIAIYKLLKKKLTQETEERIVSRAFMVLLGLIVVITALDISRFFK
jgi:regulator of sigma E protease